ncbi:NHL repeat-containing protein [Dawidia soli]|uniref:NHL repeat-containing protein n=1 Tax=Dawidia soli TaxID=2782352 RepID=A0AAP2DEY8_9BACT|nr:hypothetical protein [Dawidia soli]MBT1690768.1 hypothetical protein [Dawidia soli]
MHKYVLFLAALMVFALSSCSDSSEENPGSLQGVEFEGADAAIDVYAGDTLDVKIKNFNGFYHRLILNDKVLDQWILEEKDGYVTHRIVVPPRIGSGHLVLSNKENEQITGPALRYNKQYVRVFFEGYFLGTGMTRLQNDVMALYEGTDEALKTLRYAGFSTETNIHYAVFNLRGSTLNRTEFNYDPGRIDYTYGGTGIAASRDGEKLYFFLRTDIDGPMLSDVVEVPTSTLTQSSYTPAFYTQASERGKLGWVSGLASDSKGNLFTVEHERPYIQKITNGLITRFAGGDEDRNADGTGVHAGFQTIQSIVIDEQDNLYVADSNRIRKITPAGVVTTLAGSTEAGNRDGAVADARFNTLAGIAIGDDGVLYVYDRGNKGIRIINAEHTQVSTLHMYDLWQFSPGAHDSHMSMTVDSKGNVYLLQSSESEHDIFSNGFSAFLFEDNIPGEVFDDIITFRSNTGWAGKIVTGQ